MPSVSPLAQGEADAVDGAKLFRAPAFGDREMHAQILDLEDRLRRRIERLDAAILARVGPVQARHRLEQHLGVVVLRLVENVVDLAALDDLAAAHHRNAVGHARDHAHIVADEDDRGLQLGLEVAHDVEDLGLHGDVERRGRLVGDQQVGAAHHSHRDHHALAHAAGQLVRVLAHAPGAFGNAHQFEYFQRALLGLVLGQAVMDAQGFP